MSDCQRYGVAQFSIPNMPNFIDDMLMSSYGPSIWRKILCESQGNSLHDPYRLKTEAYGIKVLTDLLLQSLGLLETLGKLAG